LLFVSAGYATSAYDFDGTNAGRIYVYDFAGATPTTPILTIDNPDWGDYISPYLTSSNDGFANFYGSMAVDGNYLVVGAYSEDTYETNNGIAYVYDISSGTPEEPVFILRPTEPGENSQGSQFGHSVGISGNIVTVSASHQYANRFYEENYDDLNPYPYAGVVYVYDISSGTPTTPIAVIENPVFTTGREIINAYDGTDSSSGYFGYTLNHTGNYLVIQQDIGTDNILRVYDLSTPASPVELYIVRDSLGVVLKDFSEAWRGVAIDGTSLFVGATTHGTDKAGAVLELDITTGNTISEIDWEGPIQNHFWMNFGVRPWRRASENNGNYQCNYTNAVSNSMYTVVPARKHYVNGGTSDNNQVGIVRVYDTSTGNHLHDISFPLDYDNLNYEDSFVVSNVDGFGYSIALDGSELVVDAGNAFIRGAAFFYDLSSQTPTQYYDCFSYLDVNFDGISNLTDSERSYARSGNLLIVGHQGVSSHPYEQNNASGMVTVHDLTLGNDFNTTLTYRMYNPNVFQSTTNDYFGSVIQYDNNILAVTAKQEEQDNYDEYAFGVVYLYDLSSGTPEDPTDTIVVPATGLGVSAPQFGGLLILSGSILLISSNGQKQIFIYNVAGGSATYLSTINVEDWVQYTTLPSNATIKSIAYDDSTKKLVFSASYESTSSDAKPSYFFILDVSNVGSPVLIGVGQDDQIYSPLFHRNRVVTQSGHITTFINPDAGINGYTGLGSIKFFDTTSYTPAAYSGAYARLDLESYTGAYIRDAQEPYTGTYESSIPEQYTGLYERIRPAEVIAYEGLYGRSQDELFAETYTGEAFETYLGTYERTQQELYVGDYDRIESEDYLSDIYTSEYESVYVSEYTAEYQSSYQGSYNVDYTASYSTIYVGEYEGTYEGLGYTSEYTSIYETVYDAAYSGTYDSTYDATYTGDYGGTTYVSEYVSEYSGLQYTAGFDRAYEGSVYLAENYEGDAYDGETYIAEYGRTISIDVPYGFKAQLIEPPLDYEIWTLYVRIA